LDLAFWALELRHPATIAAEGLPHRESTPKWQHVRYESPARGSQPPATLTWTYGPKPPPVFEQNQFPKRASGAFVGSEGMPLSLE
jgi:hypothetical protein